METEELTKLVDGIYKNILDKFNPGARQMIQAGKAYLKALHGAAAASRLYVDAITKLARQAQQGTWGNSSDIGTALMQVVEVYKEIQTQQMNILKAFYVDLLVPLETNLEKDTKVVQMEQKKFLQQHKTRSESYSKAAANMKKYRKKGSKGVRTGLAMDKELKNMQLLEEEKSKLDAFCEQSLKTAMTQERRRYGFVLERHCSLAKHYLAYYNAGSISYTRSLDEWQEIARSREYLPESVENMFTTKLRAVSFWRDDDSSNMEDDDKLSIASQLRKTKSMDASCLDIRSINEVPSPMKPLSRAKSDFNLHASSTSLTNEHEPRSPQPRPKSMAVPEKSSWETPLVRALYAYLSSGENQLSFLEGDIIALLGERNKGWQFGENLRTRCSGWFPLAYTELITDEANGYRSIDLKREDSPSTMATTPSTPSGYPSSGKSNTTPTAVFGDSQHKLAINQPQRGPKDRFGRGLPPQHAAPNPLINKHTPPLPPLPLIAGRSLAPRPGSLHSSNDSGFSNDPPPQPEADYSDEESSRKEQPLEDSSKQPKKEVITSVRGWLLYKSAMDLWEDVSNAHDPLTKSKSAGPVVGTLGRYSSQDLLEASPVAIDTKPVIKRTKSMWKFRKNSEVMEGMALWKHRSLIDVTNVYEDVKNNDVDSVMMVNDHVTEKLLPRTKLLGNKEWNTVSGRVKGANEDKNGVKCGPWYDLWGVDGSVLKKDDGC